MIDTKTARTKCPGGLILTADFSKLSGIIYLGKYETKRYLKG